MFRLIISGAASSTVSQFRDGKREVSLQPTTMQLVPTEPMQRLPRFEARPSRSKQPTRLACGRSSFEWML